MSDPILWDRDPHTAAKHRVLRAYLDGWIPVGLFERRLGLNPAVEHVRSFALRTQDGNDYRLVLGVGHDKGPAENAGKLDVERRGPTGLKGARMRFLA